MSPNKKIVCLTMLFLAILVTAGCKTGEELMDATDNNGEFELDQGQVFAITLESNRSTGYQWQVVEFDDSILRQVGSAKYEPSNPVGPPGTGGLETFRFAARKSGRTTLKLVYTRPWEKDSASAQNYSLQLLVR